MPAAEPQHGLASLGPHGEAAWQRLRRQLELEPGFWLGFVFCSSPQRVATLRHRTDSFLSHRARRLNHRNPATPEALHDLLPRVADAQSTQTDVLWIDAIHVDGATAAEQNGPWARAWDWLMMRANEHREVLQRRLGGGLIFAVHRTWKPRVRTAAPDLWSIRTLVIDLEDVPVDDMRETGLEPPHVDEDGVDADAALAALAQLEDDPQQGDTTPALFRAATALQAAGRTKEARHRVDELAEKLRGTQSNPRLKAQLALLDGRVAAAEGDVGRGKNLIAQAVKRFRALCQDSAIPLARRDLADALIQLANIEDASNRALQALEEALDIRRSLVETQGETPETLWDLCVALMKVGHAQLQAEKYSAAYNAFKETLSLNRCLVELVGKTPQTLRNRAIALERVGDVHRRFGDDAAATAAFDEARGIRRQLDAAREPQSPSVDRSISR